MIRTGLGEVFQTSSYVGQNHTLWAESMLNLAISFTKAHKQKICLGATLKAEE